MRSTPPQMSAAFALAQIVFHISPRKPKHSICQNSCLNIARIRRPECQYLVTTLQLTSFSRHSFLTRDVTTLFDRISGAPKHDAARLVCQWPDGRLSI